MTRMISSDWTRRQWIRRNVLTLAALAPQGILTSRRFVVAKRSCTGVTPATAARAAAQAERLDPEPWQMLARRAVEAAHAAGARYADARLTRQVIHEYGFLGGFLQDEELVGVGVRVLVDGYWGFSASTVLDLNEVVQLAENAVNQARANAKGSPWTVELGAIPVATGSWATPVRIDPFAVPIEEKLDYVMYIKDLAGQAQLGLYRDGVPSFLRFLREERVVATSEGALFTQTCYESVGRVVCGGDNSITGQISGTNKTAPVPARGLDLAAAGWELILDADVPKQLISGEITKESIAKAELLRLSKPGAIGRYTLVCDGATMARLLESTWGVATQLDRALEYEANGRGTSFIDDPLAMVGNAQIASPLITVTANRSAPKELATVKWDDEGVEPTPFSLIKDGVLVDFQTTREQAAWLAPYYQQHGQPVRSHGCAVAESAHVSPVQQMPNLVLEPSTTTVGLGDLIADVQKGILVEGGITLSVDSQARTGVLATVESGQMRQIQNGRPGKIIVDGAILFNTQDLWKNAHAIGGPSTVMTVGTSKAMFLNNQLFRTEWLLGNEVGKGEPPQFASRSIRAAAATLPNQALINPLN